jgi:hypothetical protein
MCVSGTPENVDNSQYVYQATYASVYGQRPVSVLNTPQKYPGSIVDRAVKYTSQL